MAVLVSQGCQVLTTEVQVSNIRQEFSNKQEQYWILLHVKALGQLVPRHRTHIRRLMVSPPWYIYLQFGRRESQKFSRAVA